MKILRWFVTTAMKLGLRVLCRVDAQAIKEVQARGPLIVYANHTGSIEVPLIFGELYPRPVSGWAKIESWDNRFLNWIFSLWSIIPIRRGEADMSALKKALQALKQGMLFGVAPEGTRNKTGRLIRARPGVVVLATLANAPLIPIANWGGENFLSNLKKFKRTDFHIRVGKPFRLETNVAKVTPEMRQEIVDEMMYRLATLLPEEYRGEYSDLEKATGKYLVNS
ncbi:MAG: 1-acyl-sn-glycerol-3-phosphate acyltransferase [Chloroflexi bacterium]|nr:1-acyl-sn-glycerol-3-phosphate acyltransferase [Chloroflexota bacterium]